MRAILLILLLLLAITPAAIAQSAEQIANAGISDKQKADSLFKYARRYFQRAKFDSAGMLLNKGLGFALKTNIDTLIGQYYVEKGNLGIMQSNTSAATANLWVAKYWLDRTFHYHNLNSCYVLLAKCHVKNSNADSALYYFRKSEELCQQYNSYRRWLTYVEMGSFFATSDNFDEAQKYFEKAYAITKAGGVRFDHGLSIYHLTQFYYKRNMPEKFARLLVEQQEFIKGVKRDLSKDPLHSFLYVDWGKDATLENRIAFLNNVRNKLFTEGAITNGCLVNEEIAIQYEKEGQTEEALKYVTEAVQLSEKENNASNIYVYQKLAYRLQKKLGRVKEANETADRLFALKDSVSTHQNLELAMNLDAKYQTEKKEKEIALLNSQKELGDKTIALLNSQNQLKENAIELLHADKKLAALKLQHEIDLSTALTRENDLKDSVLNSEKAYSTSLGREKEKETALNAALGRENQLKENELNKEKKLRWSLTGGAALLLLSGIVILGLYRKQKTKNAIIQKQSDDLQVLMKEIHHRVKNNMQIVSSLLDLQSISIKDSQASEAVKEGKNRVQSMALIHQNLYSEDNLKGIKAKQYITNLLQNLADSYNISNDKVKIVAEIQDLNLDVDTMIPIGLILNELLTNSFKYAFSGSNTGLLQVQLQQQQESLLLKVKDNGPGFPGELDAKTAKSFGLRMIRAFAQKLKASMHIANENGAVVELNITKFSLA